jgi:hypothetical protein
MTFSKKFFPSIVLVLLVFTSYSQNNQEYLFDNIGWSITLPQDFALYDFIDESRNMQQSSGMDDEYDASTDMFASQTMLLAIKDRFNYFNITITPFDSEEDGSWELNMQAWKQQAYKNMAKLIDKEKLDTASSVEYIDGIAFSKFHIAVRVNENLRLDMFLLSRWYNGFDFCITYLNVDEEARKQIEMMLHGSRFRKG